MRKAPKPWAANTGKDAFPDQFWRPEAWQCTLLLLRMIAARDEEFKKNGIKRTVSRARISQNTIRRLCRRTQLSPGFLRKLQEHTLAAGWAFFAIGPTYYAVIKLEAAQGWGRISDKRIADELKSIRPGGFAGYVEDLLKPKYNGGDGDEEETDGEM